MNKKLIISLVLILSSFASVCAFAEGEADDPGGMSGDGCGNYNHTGGKCSVVWYEYTYNENATSANPRTYIPVSYNGSTKWGDYGEIGKTENTESWTDSCRGKANKFYAKGVAMANTNEDYIYTNSQQFGMAPANYKSVSLDSYSGYSSVSSYAFAEKFQIGGSFEIDGVDYRLTTLTNFGGNFFARHYEKTSVANGHIVDPAVAHEAFCRAAGADDIDACKGNNTTTLNTTNGSFTFEGDSNPASWFCGEDNTKKEEELNSTSNVTIRTSAHGNYASATANDGETKDGTPSGNTNAGQYEYQTSSIVYSADSTVLNKIAFTDAMCRSAGGFMSFAGSPSVLDSNIFGSPSGRDNSTKCSTYSPSGTTYTSFILFPGEQKTYSAKVTHPSKIVKSGDTVSRASGSVDETSEAKITLTAAPIKCWNDERYEIGNGVFTNYYRLGLGKNDSGYNYTNVYPYTYAEDKKNVTVWAKPGDTIRYAYDFCGGVVLKDDIDGVANDTIKTKNYYNITSGSNFADKDWIWNASGAKISNLGINGSNFGDSVTSRISNSYVYRTTSPNNQSYEVQNNSDLIGSVIVNHLGETSGSVNTPYNYYLDPKAEVSSSFLSIGNEVTVKASVSSNPRLNLNAQLNESYETNVKNITRAATWIFTLSKDDDLDTLKGAVGSSSIDGDYYYQGGETDIPINRFASANIVANSGVNIGENKEIKYTVGDNEAIGTKVCSLVAVWPADSHNLLNADDNGVGQYNISANDNQDAALTKKAGSNPYWRFSVNCQTIGKYPTMSIEGGSMVASGTVETTTTNFKGGIFGSWAEYDLVASKANFAGSGASFAYATPKTIPNEQGDYAVDGLRGGAFRVPQTLGNLSLDYGIGSDAQNVLQLSKKFAENIKSFCYDTDGNATDDCAVLPDGTTSIDDSYSGFVLYKAKNDSSFVIYDDIYNYSKNAVIVIYGKTIKISNNAKHIDAIIIAEDDLDTCEEADRDKKMGNQALLVSCSDQLIINGAVYSRGKVSDTENHLLLDRVYGAGSFDQDELRPESLLQRAEIFNFDPRIVKISQDINEKLDVTEIQYIKEIAPRY